MPKSTFFNLSSKRRETIIDHAIDEFSNNSYLVASISNIVRKAEMSKGSFYQYFEDKRELYYYLIELFIEEKEAYFNNLELPDVNFFSRFRLMTEQQSKFILSHPRLAKMVERAIHDDAAHEVMEVIQNQTEGFFYDLVLGAKKRGEINSKVDTEVAVFVLNTLFNHFGKFLQENYDEAGAKKAFGNLIDILQRGLQ